jgi:hypothetical protein
MKLKRDWRRFLAEITTKLKPDWPRFWADMRAPPALPMRILGNLVVTFVLLIAFLVAAKFLDWIRQHVSPGWLFATILVASFGLFYVRRFCRLGYGFLEVLLGLVLVADTIFGPTPDPSRSDEPVIKIAAGMYLAIRGIDNCMIWLTPKLGGAPPWVRGNVRSLDRRIVKPAAAPLTTCKGRSATLPLATPQTCARDGVKPRLYYLVRQLNEHHGQHLPLRRGHHDPEIARPIYVIHRDRSRNCRKCRGDSTPPETSGKQRIDDPPIRPVIGGQRGREQCSEHAKQQARHQPHYNLFMYLR